MSVMMGRGGAWQQRRRRRSRSLLASSALLSGLAIAACGGRSQLKPGISDDGVVLPGGGAGGTGFAGTSFGPGGVAGGSSLAGAFSAGAGGTFAGGGGTAGGGGVFGGGTAGSGGVVEPSGGESNVAGAPADCPVEGDPSCPLPIVVQLAAGDEHTCALFLDGSVKCWGKNNHGQLGYGNTEAIGDDELPSSVGFVSVSTKPGVRVKQLVAGVEHTCALLSDATVVCWGSNFAGQLGYGNTEDVGDDELPSSVGPVSVSASSAISATAIGAGAAHTCALLSNAAVRCWGADAHGALGYGELDVIGDDELPSSVGPVSISTTAGVVPETLSVGRFNTCVLLSDDTAKCWGFNEFGQLGYGDMETIGDDELPSSVGALSLSATVGVVPDKLVIGDFHMCALLSNRTVRCWGSNIDGELGSGNQIRVGDDELPSSVDPVSVGPDGEGITGLVGGYNHTCAFLSDASVKCWGSSFAGQLGNGNVENIGDDELPSSVDALVVTAGATIKALAGGYAHTCALLSDGSVKCWGENKRGQLGYGHTASIGDDELPSSVAPVELF